MNWWLVGVILYIAAMLLLCALFVYYDHNSRGH